MEVYIEVVFIDNFLIDYIILWLCGYIAKRNLKWWRISLACLIGVAIAIVAVLDLNGVLIFFLKIFSSVAMVLTAFGIVGFFKNLLYFYFVTFSIGGVALGVLFLKEGVNFGIFGSLSSVPTGMIFGVIFFGYLLTRKVIYIYNIRRSVSACTYSVEIFHGGRGIFLAGFLDTGNLLVFGGDPRGVSVGDYLTFLEIFRGDTPVGEIFASFAEGGTYMSVYKAEKMVVRPLLAGCATNCNKKVSGGKNKRENCNIKANGGKNETADCGMEFEGVCIALAKHKISAEFQLILSPHLF